MTDTPEAPDVPDVEAAPMPVAPPAKVDPESLALRFKRGAVVGVAAAASIGVAATAWIALKPRAFHIVAATADTGDSATPAYSFRRAV